MNTRKLPLYAGLAAIVVAAGATTLTLSTSETAEAPSSQAAASTSGPAITIYKNPNCGCCKSWAEHLEVNGFKTTIIETNDLNEIKQQYNVPREMASCHTALIDDLVIEGHVPASDIVAYLENPQFNAIGLSVPGMVQGSPGMETGVKQDYQVVTFRANGQQSVFREYKDY
ncbi:MAG: DUF411 domain-containing protein [Natronospirillum sp.]